MAMIIMTVVITGTYYFVSDVSEEFGVEVDADQYTAIYDRTNDLAESMNATYEKLTSENVGLTDQFFTGLNLAWSSIKLLVTTPFSIFAAIIQSIITSLGLPAWVAGLFLITITGLVVFAMIAALLRWDP